MSVLNWWRRRRLRAWQRWLRKNRVTLPKPLSERSPDYRDYLGEFRRTIK